MSVVMGQIGMPSQTAAIQDASASAGGVTFAAANLIEILAKCFVNDPLNQIGMDGFVVELGQPETIV
jgi:hypothetical protein